ncbi:MAG: phenylalanine--tRNA ligase subunit beta [Candidatus Nezhaarchaeota archaeon]|nr:phenylalanine--tRNA ligase subunit beta [Candidatus Nezhaarchaeota archaeon]MCX8142048.1 phenylalanine--tRNA ligase subunit beta [Candidatus Nezhaarchaeota archaeon]MDW8050171.1 phenylalanine--tRNA ligase subunit beta [Nitrososphaerota archaeon]
MPTISISKKDLIELVGKRDLTDEELVNTLNLMKAEVKSLGPDEVLIEVTADRPDMFSTEGIARSLKGFLEVEVGLPNYMVEGAERDYAVYVENIVRDVRPYVACAVVKECNLGYEGFRQLIQLQEVLHRTHGRNRRKFAIGLHNFDVIDPPITYTAKPFDSFSFVPLGEDIKMTGREILEKHAKGKEYGWIIGEKAKAPLLIDSGNNILSMPPIINSNLTKVTPQTRNILIDVTGIDLKAVRWTLTILACNLAERGGKIVQFKVHQEGDVERVEPLMECNIITVSHKRLIEITGIEEPITRVIKSLRRVRMEAMIRGDETIDVLVPPYRIDIMDDVDVAEEYAIGYGYDRISPIMLPITAHGMELKITSFSRLCRELMIGYGFQEVVSYMITSDVKLDSAFMYGKRAKVTKPVSSDYTCLRTSLIPPLLDFLSENTHVEYPQKIFEVGDVVLIDDRYDVMSFSERRLAALHADYKVGYEDIQAVLYSLLRSLGLKFEVQSSRMGLMIDGRCGSVRARGIEVGYLGEVKPEVLLKFGLQMPVAAFEISVSKILELLNTSINTPLKQNNIWAAGFLKPQRRGGVTMRGFPDA